MNASELREQTVEELERRERELTRELWNNRMKNYTNQLDDTASLHRIRREIARIKTILGERRATAANQAAKG